MTLAKLLSPALMSGTDEERVTELQKIEQLLEQVSETDLLAKYLAD